MKYILLLFIIMSGLFAKLKAQHEHHNMANMNDSTPMQKKDTSMPVKKMNIHAHHSMSSAYSRSLPMNRNGSGTSWVPDNSPMYMIMKHDMQGGMWMFHGGFFFRYNTQQLTDKTSRSGSKFDAPNWLMAMYNRPVGKNGLFTFKSMLSLDPFTVGKNGYPLLFQSGEAFKGEPLVDRQHPHDLFAELSLGYSQRLGKDIDIYGYFGYPGEPALGPPAFMHRISAMNDPDAPIGHHWQDATHITFGVATAGIRLNKFKIELSSFNGKEPDEHRYDFDAMQFNSYSYRISYNPANAWSLQFSQGYLKSPERLHSEENIWRYTASALYSSPVSLEGRYFNAALVWGMNDAGHHHKEHSVLLEATNQFQKLAIYSRYEFVQKGSEELNLEQAYGDKIFNIHKITVGTNRKLFGIGVIDVVGGVQTSLNLPPQSLKVLYGNSPMSGEVYLQVRPRLNL